MHPSQNNQLNFNWLPIAWSHNYLLQIFLALIDWSLVSGYVTAMHSSHWFPLLTSSASILSDYFVASFISCHFLWLHGAPGKIELYVPFSTLIISLQRRCYRRKVSEKVTFDHVAISDFSVLVLCVISNNTVSVCLALPQYQRWEGHGNLLNCAIVMTAISDTSYKSMSHRDFLFPLIYSTQFRVFFKVCC